MTLVDGISLYAIISIWLLMIMNAILSIGGFIYYMQVEKKGRGKPLKEYPTVSIMVPAHNEALVIVRTVRALLNMEYPKDRYEIIVINDNSTDDTAQKLEELQREFPDRKLIAISTGPEVGGKGKSNALNIGFSVSTGEVCFPLLRIPNG